MIRWLAGLPGWALFPVMFGVGVTLTLVLDSTMRRFVSSETRGRASATAGVTLQVVATIYAILIAFVIVDEYSQIRSAQDQVYDKVSGLSIVFENSRDLPDREGEPVRETTLAYARSVITNGLPNLEEHDRPDLDTDQKLEAVYRALQGFEPTTESQRAAYSEMLDALDAVTRTRQQLINAAGSSVPNELVWLLGLIGVTVMAVATMLDTQHRRSHLFILSALALVIWLTLALVVSLDYPFEGIIRVDDTPVQDFIRFRAAR
jgi:hypothetical protein